MPAVEAASDVLEVLKKSRLLPGAEFDKVVNQFGLEDQLTPQDVTETLVNEGLITQYQADRLLAGKRRGYFVDEYKILDILGSGGMGYLFSAEEPDSKWIVALKVLSDKYRDDKGMVSRFHMEAEAGLKLNHPNILRTKAIRRTEDIYGTIHYMVMELVKGVSLYELLAIRGKTLPWDQACDVIYQAAKGLHHAHELGLVHRDVKPENLLIRTDGAVKVLDFGLAMFGGSEAEFSMATILGQNCLGTADYIAPEQSIDSFEVDRRADVYSLGCTFYFILTGKVPFPYKTVPEKLQGHRTKKARPVTEFRPKVPERVSKIIQKMMAKNPENRIQDCEQVCRYLERYCDRKPIDFDFESVLEQRAETARRRQAAESKLRNESRVSSVSELDISKSSMMRRAKKEDTVIQRGDNTSKDTRVQKPREE